jgi:cation:H+ antiporter
MIIQLFIFFTAFFLVIRSAMLANKHATRLAESFNLPTYTVGFIIVAIISILPETFITINSALADVPEFGFGMILGSNIADLTLIVALVIFLSRRSLKIESRILRTQVYYPFVLLLPIVLGLDGHLSRPEGGALILAGCIFYYVALRHHAKEDATHHTPRHTRPLLLLLASMALLLVGAHYVVTSATSVATTLGLSPVLIGMLIIGLGTTLPELIFSFKAMRIHDDSLAIGDILGTVLADATIVVGLLALINPFSFPTAIIYVAGIFMVASAFILFSFMYSGKVITRREAFALIVFWITFVLVEVIVTTA